jgi:glycosyltransferase involved in cell wall biosynthesis
MKKPLISIIIPCFNAELFIKETLESILNQTEQDFEIVLVNDGSVDNTISIIESINDSRIILMNQVNSGVSIARNNGLIQAQGEFVVFFDADDLMTSNFLGSRVEALRANKSISYAFSDVISFKGLDRNDTLDHVSGAGINLAEEILFYDPSVSTCPSNYMVRNSDLIKFSVSFNPQIASHADRYFLLQLNKNGLEGVFVKAEENHLLYRVLENSMSHQLSIGLANDAESYYLELIKNNFIPNNIRANAISKGFYIIGGTYFKLGKTVKAIQYLIRGFISAPLYFLKLL